MPRLLYRCELAELWGPRAEAALATIADDHGAAAMLALELSI